MNTLKAIETRYANHLFRSRLEARYAVYFDSLGIKWIYEDEGYGIVNGYLPDFFLPEFRLFIEIKGKEFTWQEHKKCKLLAVQSEKNVVEAVGLPELKPVKVWVPGQEYVCSKCGLREQYDELFNRIFCQCKTKQRVTKIMNEAEGFLLLKASESKYNPIYWGCQLPEEKNIDLIKAAMRKASEARFEFNDKNK